MPPNTMGEKIRALRKEAGLTLEQLADATDSSKSYIWELENKNMPRPSAEKIGRIAATLGVTPEFLLDTAEENPTQSVVDEAFYRKYRKLDPEVKAKIRSIVDVWEKD